MTTARQHPPQVQQLQLFKQEGEMRCWFRKYSLRMVQEESAMYDCSRKVQNGKDVAEVCRVVLGLHEMAEEHLAVLFLDAKNVVMGISTVSHGTLTASLIHPREVYKAALLANCNSIILAHNHPSGDVQPSAADKNVTRVIKDAGSLLQIELLDHVIVGVGGAFYSFRDNRDL